MRRAKRALLFLLVSATCIGCDRVAKAVATEELRSSEPVTFLGGVVRFEYAENPGAFLGLGRGLSESARFWWLGIATAIVLAWMLVAFFRRARAGAFESAAIALIVAGGAGNLVDRLVHGRVVDFVSVGIGGVRTGIFNVADVAITGGALALVAAGLLRSRRERANGSGAADRAP